jgi:putative transposase
MPRPERIEYEDAYYHVMNRGRDGGRRNLFFSKEYFDAFLQTLAEAVERFDIVVHAYCLMTNHYHLLIQTPHANISRAMRHINGVYTQRYNRLKHTDGPLFRGRFKSILVDSDAYLLQLSRYIHRNPIETKKPMVAELTDYLWSSYPAYVNKAEAPDWLYRDQIYNLLSSKQRYVGYTRYVAEGNNETITRFYNQGNTAQVIGDKDFLGWLKETQIPMLEDSEYIKQVVAHGLPIAEIVKWTAYYYQTDEKQLIEVIKGRQETRTARKVAIYLSQQLGGHSLNEIKNYFGLNHIGSVSFTTSSIRAEVSSDLGFKREVENVKSLIIEKVT